MRLSLKKANENKSIEARESSEFAALVAKRGQIRGKLRLIGLSEGKGKENDRKWSRSNERDGDNGRFLFSERTVFASWWRSEGKKKGLNCAGVSCLSVVRARYQQ